MGLGPPLIRIGHGTRSGQITGSQLPDVESGCFNQLINLATQVTAAKHLASGCERSFLLTSLLIELIDLTGDRESTPAAATYFGAMDLEPSRTSYNRAAMKPSLSLKQIGIWTGAFEPQPARKVQEAVAELEELGYGAVWFSEAFGR
jgi:hypothetical protein